MREGYAIRDKHQHGWPKLGKFKKISILSIICSNNVMRLEINNNNNKKPTKHIYGY